MRAPAGRKALGNGVDDDDVLRRFLGKGAEGLQRLAAVDELAVGFVADEEQIVLLGEVNEHLHLVVRQHHAGGVAGFVTMMARVCSLMSGSIFSRSA